MKENVSNSELKDEVLYTKQNISQNLDTQESNKRGQMARVLSMRTDSVVIDQSTHTLFAQNRLSKKCLSPIFTKT